MEGEGGEEEERAGNGGRTGGRGRSEGWGEKEGGKKEGI